MAEIANRLSPACANAPEDEALKRRLWRAMCASVAVAVAFSAALAPWRTATGLLLGGALSLFNHHWLSTSVGAMLRVGEPEERARLKLARFVVRYFVVALIVAAAVWLNVVSLAATLVGMCSFVAAILVEASWQFYKAALSREDN